MIPPYLLRYLRFVPENSWVPSSPISRLSPLERRELRDSLPLHTPHPAHRWYWFGGYNQEGRPVASQKGGVQRILYKLLVDPYLPHNKRLVNHLTTSIEDVNPYKASLAQPRGTPRLDNRRDFTLSSPLAYLREKGISNPKEVSVTLLINLLEEAGYQPVLILKLLTNLGV